MSFDLNISNYKMSELEDMFELPPNYSQPIIMNKEEQVRKKNTGRRAHKQIGKD